MTTKKVRKDQLDSVWQAKDIELTALASVTSAADALPYFTGAGAAATTTFTAYARTLLDDATAAAARVTLGVEIGVNVQAQDAELASIAGLTSAANKLPYFTGSGTAALADYTAFARTLDDDADAAAARTTLGVVIGTNVQAYNAGLAQVAGLAAPGADRILFWDHSALSYAYLSMGTAISITGTTLNVTAGAGDLLAANNLSDVTNAATARTNLGLAIGANVQAQNANLSAVAGLTSAADRLPYFTGSGTAALATYTAFARTLDDDATAADARTTLGVVIGTNVQAFDATLASLAAYNTNGLLCQTAADTFAGRAVTGTANLITVTNGDGVAGNPTLTVGSLVCRTDVVSALTRQNYFAETTLTDGATINWNLDQNQCATVTLGGNRTLANPTNMQAGATYLLRVVQDGTGSRTLSYGAAYKWPAGAAPVLTTAAGAVDLISFYCTGTTMLGVCQKGFA